MSQKLGQQWGSPHVCCSTSYHLYPERRGTLQLKDADFSSGTFLNGKKFDSSRDRKAPMDFTFKQQPMIPGFEEGLEMLGKGGKGIFIIPYYNAYGPAGRPGGIPPYADLIFDLEVLEVK